VLDESKCLLFLVEVEHEETTADIPTNQRQSSLSVLTQNISE